MGKFVPVRTGLFYVPCFMERRRSEAVFIRVLQLQLNRQEKTIEAEEVEGQ